VLRVVTIKGVDRSACGGTHVRSTAEIGPVFLRGHEKVKRAVRIEFVCGTRAVHTARSDFDCLSRAAQRLSASIAEVPELVAANVAQLKAESAARRKLAAEVNVYRARLRYDEAGAGNDGIVRVVESNTSMPQEDLRSFALAYIELPRAVFIAASPSPPSILRAASSDSGLDAGRVLKTVLDQFGGRGGGSPRLAQGSLPSHEALEGALSALMDAS
jgi:alanyl-tRNA synthetase